MATIVSTSLPRVRVSRVDHDDQNKQITLSVEPGEELIDIFEGVKYKWLFHTCKEWKLDEEELNRYTHQVSSYELTFDNKYKDMVLTSYLPYIEDKAEEIKLLNRKLKLHMNDGEYWRSVDFCHPITFDTLVMDSELKQMWMEDLKRFVKRKDYYKKIGKAWKRGYLLYGPPGTGMSSLVTAIANFLKFDIYDLELTGVEDNIRALVYGLVIEFPPIQLTLSNGDEHHSGATSPLSKMEYLYLVSSPKPCRHIP